MCQCQVCFPLTDDKAWQEDEVVAPVPIASCTAVQEGSADCLCILRQVYPPQDCAEFSCYFLGPVLRKAEAEGRANVVDDGPRVSL